MAKDSNLINMQAVQLHLGIVQSTIQRMAANSASCKTWCITLVSAILVIVAEKKEPNYAYIIIVPIILFFILDSYYLALEKVFILCYNNFIDKLHNETVTAKDLYVISPHGSLLKMFLKANFSFSVWPFYITLIILGWIAKLLVI